MIIHIIDIEKGYFQAILVLSSLYHRIWEFPFFPICDLTFS